MAVATVNYTSGLYQKLLKHIVGEAAVLQNVVVIPQRPRSIYCSTMYRLHLRYTLENESEESEEEVEHQEAGAKNRVIKIFVKDVPSAFFSISKEHILYGEILPRINQILHYCGTTRISPKLYYALTQGGSTHMLEDLSAIDYVTRPRTIGYNEDEARFIIKRLGEFHGASYFYTSSHSEIIGKLQRIYQGSLESNNIFLEEKLVYNIEYASDIVGSWPGYECIAMKMRRNTRETFRNKFLPLFDVGAAKFSVITHGDMWVENVLLKYDEDDGLPEDAKFVDYRNCSYSSPAFDLHNFLITSLQLPVLMNHTASLIEDYYSSFYSVLLSIHYPHDRIPTLDCVLSELRRTEYYSYYLLMYPFAEAMLSEDLAYEKSSSLNNVDSDLLERCRKNIYSNPRVLETYKYILKTFEQNHLLDE
ncbi:unnamed protein product [Ceratitis capitata]|uniref:(Mediterranean fruit fly) hypothetical protein n=1 Tax=Ceratitis capitata TaxID=7213 RepID=A0A811V5Q8_CERCA|nr:unnamed protein product [Ceratitis capitata]